VETLPDRWRNVQERVADAAIRAGRNPADIRIIAISKTMPLERILEAREAGITRFGENRIQEALRKFGAGREKFPDPSIEMHLVGHLQTNKARKALDLFDVIHSVDSLHLAETISRIAQETNRTVSVLVEVNTSEEESKYGVPAERALELVRQMAPLPNIAIQGLMTVGAWLPDPEEVRPCFVMLRKLRDRISEQHIPNLDIHELSMGMTNDFEVAVEEGATMVRIGTAIFGPRNV
jgi:pyridoxal phosphate enzyme (YggS family)